MHETHLLCLLVRVSNYVAQAEASYSMYSTKQPAVFSGNTADEVRTCTVCLAELLL